MKFKIKKRLLVDMTASILHHGHIRLLKKAKKLGNVEIIVALTTDNEVKKHKGYYPDLKFRFRKEILESIKYVDEIKPSKWQIDDEYLAKHKIDFLVHGSDNSNKVSKNKLLIFRRTNGVSSFDLRKRIKKKKIIYFFLIKKFFNLYQIFFIFQTIAAKNPTMAAIIALPEDGSI